MPRKRKITTFLEVEKHNGIWFFWELVNDDNKALAGFVVGNRLAELIISGTRISGEQKDVRNTITEIAKGIKSSDFGDAMQAERELQSEYEGK